MIQSIDSNINKPNYNAVRINIAKPELNVGENTVTNDNGIFNAVDINIDNPTVKTEPKKIYDYPEAESLVTFDNIRPLPHGFHVAYQTTNVILPKIENEYEVEAPETKETEEAEDVAEVEEETTENNDSEEIIGAASPEEGEKKNNRLYARVTSPSFTGVEDETKIQKPEIVPSEDILPEVDIPLVTSNLTSTDFDVQAQQMEEIARVSLDNPENAVPYIVRDVFTSLIEIAQKDTRNLTPPTEEQIEARKKVITNFLTMETAKNPQQVKLPYDITEKEIALASEISPMEQAERNKEYALYTMAILAKVYTDEIEKHTGNIVPLTDIPGVSATVDALRYNPNSGVKIAAIDALRYIQRPEYKEELTTLYTLAQADTNPNVSLAATEALNKLSQ